MKVYAIGYQRGPKSFGMSHGPTLNLREMLDVRPNDDEPAVLFEFDDSDVSERELYRWRGDKWEKVESDKEPV